MNFKTTIVLAVLLLIGGVLFFVTRNNGAQQNEKSVESQQKVFSDLQPTDVTKLTIAPAEGAKLALEKSGAAWHMTEPVNAPAEYFEVDALVRAIANLESTNIVSDATATGIDHPRYTIDLSAGNKDYSLLVGSKTAVGDSLYVALKGKDKTLVVPSDLLTQLAKPASTYRDPKLANMSTAQVTKVEIDKPDGSKLVLDKTGNDWKVAGPTPIPAEKADVDDILFALTGLKATEFVAEDLKDAASYELSPARFTATLSASPTTLPTGVAAPATAPTSQPASVIIKLGRYDDVLKKNVYATSSQVPVIAKVGATIIDTINKKPLDVRDRRVVDIDSAEVSRIAITSDIAATTRPTTRPASKTAVAIQRRHATTAPSTGEASSTTAPATAPATTKSTTTPPATQPKPTHPATQALTKWEVETAGAPKPADDAKVDLLLSQLHPLRATKYLESSSPATQLSATYSVTIITQGAGGEPPRTIELRLVDPGDSKPLVGTYNGLTFELDRMIIDRLTGDFLKGSTPAAPSGFGHEAPTNAPGSTFAP